MVVEPFATDVPLPNAFRQATASASSRAEADVAAILTQQRFGSSAKLANVPRITVRAGEVGAFPDDQGV
jgi:hypothetical protein